jgi:hypothetical protein
MSKELCSDCYGKGTFGNSDYSVDKGQVLE